MGRRSAVRLFAILRLPAVSRLLAVGLRQRVNSVEVLTSQFNPLSRTYLRGDEQLSLIHI